ncbi:hypothetical protein STEG23_024980, partial [Scotinomys teguina]
MSQRKGNSNDGPFEDVHSMVRLILYNDVGYENFAPGSTTGKESLIMEKWHQNTWSRRFRFRALVVGPMESQADTPSPSSQSVESCTLDLPTAYDIRGHEVSQGASSKSLSSLESHSFPCSLTADS